MSNVEKAPAESRSGGRAECADGPVHELLTGREALIGPRGTTVTRTLPHRDRRTIGAWCFVDLFGPEVVVPEAANQGMRVPPHPHMGLQTVTWLVEGEVLHRDSVGSEQSIRPGQLNLMTAGRAISHSEESPRDRPPRLHGVQLWVALPDSSRQGPPHFEHHADLPVLADRGLSATVLMGRLAGESSAAATHSPLVGAELRLTPGTRTVLPLERDFEHAVLLLTGAAEVDGVPLAPGPLLYLGTGRTELPLATAEGARLLLIGGEPFDEQLLMWWNFVGRDHEEIVAARTAWEAGREHPAESPFGEVHGFDGPPLPAPALPGTRLTARPRVRPSP